MNKKTNYLAIIPIYGTCILFILLFVKLFKNEINKKKFNIYLCVSAVFGFLSILIMILFLKFVNSLLDITNFIDRYGLIFAFVTGGYLLNFFAFTLLNKKWSDLEKI